MKQINQLLELRKANGAVLTQGLSDAQLSAFADDPLLEDLIPGESEVRIWAGPGCCAGIYL